MGVTNGPLKSFGNSLGSITIYHHDAKTLLGVDTYVRKDVIGKHFPESIGALETRGYDLTVVRDER